MRELSSGHRLRVEGKVVRNALLIYGKSKEFHRRSISGMMIG